MSREHKLRDVPGHEGISECVVCDLAEGELTTHCPGAPIERRVAERVYAGVLDFRHGAWEQNRGRGLVIRLRFWGCKAPLTAVERWGTT
jgi:hypothetical protein